MWIEVDFVAAGRVRTVDKFVEQQADGLRFIKGRWIVFYCESVCSDEQQTKKTYRYIKSRKMNICHLNPPEESEKRDR